MSCDSTENNDKKVDIFRDTPVRLLGYANEVGEAFRSLVHVNVVRSSYAVASTYVCADAYSKGKAAARRTWPDDRVRQTQVLQAVVDTLLWQGLASVAIPGFTINRICFFSRILLRRLAPGVGETRRKWLVTGLGLAAIPLIIKPIDLSVDWLMENSFRKWFHVSEVLDHEVLHHTRSDR